MFKQIPGALMVVLFFAGCSHQRDVPISPSNPASPSAAEAPAPTTSQAIAPGVSGPAVEGGGETKSSPMDNMGKMEPLNMSKNSGSSAAISGSQTSEKKAVLYTCTMHPRVVKTEPGNCPICGMTLVPKKQ